MYEGVRVAKIKLLNKSEFSGNTKGAYDKKDFL